MSDNKLSDNNLRSELVGNRITITIEEIVIFMINTGRKVEIVNARRDKRRKKVYVLPSMHSIIGLIAI